MKRKATGTAVVRVRFVYADTKRCVEYGGGLHSSGAPQQSTLTRSLSARVYDTKAGRHYSSTRQLRLRNSILLRYLPVGSAHSSYYLLAACGTNDRTVSAGKLTEAKRSVFVFESVEDATDSTDRVDYNSLQVGAHLVEDIHELDLPISQTDQNNALNPILWIGVY